MREAICGYATPTESAHGVSLNLEACPSLRTFVVFWRHSPAATHAVVLEAGDPHQELWHRTLNPKADLLETLPGDALPPPVYPLRCLGPLSGPTAGHCRWLYERKWAPAIAAAMPVRSATPVRTGAASAERVARPKIQKAPWLTEPLF